MRSSIRYLSRAWSVNRTGVQAGCLAGARLPLPSLDNDDATSVSTSGRTPSDGVLHWAQAGISSLGRGFAAAAVAATSAAGPKKSKERGAAEQAGEDPSLIRVVLTKDVKGLGVQGEVVTVKRGAMRHELYPGRKAVYATPENLQQYARAQSKQQAEGEQSEEQQREAINKLLKALHRRPVVVNRRPSAANDDVFAPAEFPVSHKHIRDAVSRQLGIQLHKSHLMMEGAIDAYGTYKVPLNLRLLDGTQVELTVHVDRSKGAAEGAGPAAPGAPAAVASA